MGDFFRNFRKQVYEPGFKIVCFSGHSIEVSLDTCNGKLRSVHCNMIFLASKMVCPGPESYI